MKKTVISVIILILSVSFYNIWHINKNYIEPDVEVFEKNHWVQFDQNASTEIEVIDFDLLTEVAVVTIEKTNEEHAKNSINQAMLVTGNFSNGLHLPLTMLLNEGEPETEKLVYLITDNLMSKEHWKDINNLDFSLVVAYSPQEIQIKLS